MNITQLFLCLLLTGSSLAFARINRVPHLSTGTQVRLSSFQPVERGQHAAGA